MKAWFGCWVCPVQVAQAYASHIPLTFGTFVAAAAPPLTEPSETHNAAKHVAMVTRHLVLVITFPLRLAHRSPDRNQVGIHRRHCGSGTFRAGSGRASLPFLSFRSRPPAA